LRTYIQHVDVFIAVLLTWQTIYIQKLKESKDCTPQKHTISYL